MVLVFNLRPQPKPCHSLDIALIELLHVNDNTSVLIFITETSVSFLAKLAITARKVVSVARARPISPGNRQDFQDLGMIMSFITLSSVDRGFTASTCQKISGHVKSPGHRLISIPA